MCSSRRTLLAAGGSAATSDNLKASLRGSHGSASRMIAFRAHFRARVSMASVEGDLFRASLKRCLVTPDFLHDFYEMFMASSDEIRQKFQKTEFPRQTRVLADSLYIMAVAAESAESRDDAIAWKELDRLAAYHSRTGLDIHPKHYDSWLECLVKAAKQYDSEFKPEVERAWRQSLAPGIQHLRSRY